MSLEVLEYLKIHVSTVGLSPQVLEEISKVATLRKYKAGETALTQGQQVAAVSLIVSGYFAICRDGECKLSAGSLGPNDLLGLLAVANGHPAEMTINATEPALVIELPSDEAQRLMTMDRSFARNLVARATARMTQQLRDGGKRTTVRRVAFLHMHSTTLDVAEQVQARLQAIGETIGRITNDSRQDSGSLSGCQSFVVKDTQQDHSSAIREQLAKWLHLDRVVFDIDFETTDLRLEQLQQLLGFSEQIFLVLTPMCGEKVLPQLKAALAEAPEWSEKLSVIWVLDETFDLAPLNPELRKLVHRDFKVKTASSKDVFQHRSWPGIERIVHALRGVRLGLALGGGASKGMSHLGVLRALDEQGIVIDAIAGTSVGAMMGVPYCGGYSPDNTIERFTNALTPGGIFKWIAKGDLWYMLYKYRSNSWEGMLREHFFDWQLEQLLVPLTTIATDLVTGSEFVRTEGDSVLGILESINLGGVSKPICRDGMVLVDGGYLNNVPADTLVQDGATYVISVDVSAQIADTFAGNTSETSTQQMRVPRINQVLSRIREVAQKNLSVMGGASADITISPDISMVSFTDFKSTPKIAELGYEAAMNSMGQLKAQLNEIDPQLFPSAVT